MATDEFRLVQDLSYLCNNLHHLLVNFEINIDDFRCDWRTFQKVVDIVLDAPSGAQAATLDVDTAFRRCPILPLQPNSMIMWNNLFYIDHVTPFGASSSGGVFGHVADTLMAILCFHKIGPTLNWVNDFLFFAFPTNSDSHTSQDSNWTPIFSYSLDTNFSITSPLEWLWKASKT